MARNEGGWNDRERRDYGPGHDRDRPENREPRRREDWGADYSGGGMSRGWHGQDREQGYSGGMGSWAGESWNRSDERWGGRRQDLGRGERGPEQWDRGRDEDWRSRERGDEWRDWGQGERGARDNWSRGGGQDWNQHSASWRGKTGQFRGREAGWGGYGAYDRERTRERHQYDEGRGYAPGYGGYPNAEWERRANFAGRGPRNYQRSDERIREDVIERLTDHPDIDASEIDVEVEDCKVMLRGTVDDRHAKHLAEDIADRVWGVQDVHNEIRVQRPIETGRGSGSATFHEGSSSYPTLTTPGGHGNVASGDQGSKTEKVKSR